MLQYDPYNPKLTHDIVDAVITDVLALISIRTSVTIGSGLTTLELHITTVPVEHQANSATYYEESAQCNEIMVCVLT